MFRKVGDAPIQPTRTEVKAPDTRVADGSGLSSIRAQVPASGARPAPGTGSPAAPGGVAQLQQIAAAPKLAKLTDKSEAIAQRLGPELCAKLEARLADASWSDRRAMDRLLHFSRLGLGTTDAEKRLEVRVGIAAYLAEGGGIKEGKAIRERLLECSSVDSRAMVDRLKAQNGHPVACIADTILTDHGNGSERSRNRELTPEQFERALPALLSFPVHPSEAGENVVIAKGLTLMRDEEGKLQPRYLSLGRTNVDVPPSNTNLDAGKLQQIRAVFERVASGSYGMHGAPLDFMRFFRESNAVREWRGERALTMAEALERYRPDGAAITDRYNGTGNCMGHAEKMVAELGKIGIEAKVVGSFSPHLIKMPDPRLPDSTGENIFIPGERGRTGGATHMDVVIPYTNQEGEARAVVIGAGMGTSDFTLFNDVPAAELRRGEPGHLNIVDRGADRIDAAAAQKVSLSYQHSMQLANTSPDARPTEKRLFGIDLLAGKLYLNRAASSEYRAQQGPLAPGQQDGAITFDFKGAMADPRGPTTIKLWNEDTGAYEDTTVNKLTALLVFTAAVKEQFRQPDDFVDDIMTLAANYDAYKGTVLNPALAAQSDTKADRAAALAAKPTDTGPTALAWQSHFKAAGEAILAGDAATAAVEYRAAVAITRPSV